MTGARPTAVGLRSLIEYTAEAGILIQIHMKILNMRTQNLIPVVILYSSFPSAHTRLLTQAQTGA